MTSKTAVALPANRETISPVIVPVDSLAQPAWRDLFRLIPDRSSRIFPAWIILGVCLVFSFATLLLVAYIAIREGFTTDLVEPIIWGLLFTCSAVSGLLILQEYPGHRVGWAMCLAGFILVTAQTFTYFGITGLLYPEWGIPAPQYLIQMGCFYPVGIYLLIVELPLIFPTGRLAAPWWQAARVVGLFGASLATWSVGFGTEFVFFGIFGDIANPWYVPGVITDLSNRVKGFDLIIAMGIPAVVSMILRLRRATGVERMQLRWIAWDAAIVIVAYAILEIVTEWYSRHIPENMFWLVSSIWGLALNSIAIVVGISILRLRLYDIDIVIHRSLLYGTLVALIAVAYVLLVNLVDAGARHVDAGNPDPWVASFIVAALVAFLVHPLRERLHRLLNRWLFGARDNPADILGRLGIRLESAIAPADVLADATQTIRDLLRLPHVAIAIGAGPAPDLVAESGVPGSEQVGIPMVYQHERIGELRVTPRSPSEGFSRADREVLEGIARQTAVAAYALRVSADLQQARERLVTTREEERRRLRRDLHDGLGSQLAALTIQAGTVRRTIQSDPVAAVQGLDHLEDELRSAISDIRRLVHGLRPPALDEFGLVAALRSRLLAFEDGSGIAEIRLDMSGAEHVLPAAVEVAVYRIVEEALTNCSRHGDVRHVTVSLAFGQHIHLVIADDGRGLPERYQPGVGIHSMRERAEELSGTFAIGVPDGGGTRIEVGIPLTTLEVR